jgi:riboflavin synthase
MMFTGIVQATATIESVTHLGDFSHIEICFPRESVQGLELGASVSINGVCLTVTQVQADVVSFDIMTETLRCTTLHTLVVGDKVNIERSMRVNAEIGGHILSGHIDGLAKVIDLFTTEHNVSITFLLDVSLKKYVFNKGFIGVHGTSLTANEVNQGLGSFTVWLIPETLRKTNLGSLVVGDYVNIEVHRETQVIVDTLERMLTTDASKDQLEKIRTAIFS